MALRKINQAIGAMDQMTQQNAAMVEETNAATRNLTQEAGQLRNAFASFRIGDEQPGGLTPVLPPATPAVQRARPVLPRKIAPAHLAVRGNLALDEDWTEF